MKALRVGDGAEAGATTGRLSTGRRLPKSSGLQCSPNPSGATASAGGSPSMKNGALRAGRMAAKRSPAARAAAALAVSDDGGHG